MNYERIPPVKTSQALIESAFSTGRLKARKASEALSRRDMVLRQQNLELSRIKSASLAAVQDLDAIIGAFPQFEKLPEFYQELMSLTLNIGDWRKSLSKVNWTAQRIKKMAAEYTTKMSRCESMPLAQKLRTAFYGRLGSLLKGIKEQLLYLEACRKIMKGYPDIKPGFTVAIGGFPNVGKSTLLSRLTSAKPEIQDYPFTTKRLNIGYGKIGYTDVQFIDTPGTLNRQQMNLIERQAELCIRLISNAVIYVFDVTEPYPLADQEELYKVVKGLNDHVMCYISKTDVLAEKAYGWLAKKYNASTTAEELKIRISELLKHNPGSHNVPHQV